MPPFVRFRTYQALSHILPPCTFPCPFSRTFPYPRSFCWPCLHVSMPLSVQISFRPVKWKVHIQKKVFKPRGLGVVQQICLRNIETIKYRLPRFFRPKRIFVGMEEANSSNQHQDAFESASGSCEITNNGEDFAVSTTSNRNNVSV